MRWLAGAIACATAAVVMTITKTVHPPSGATAMIAATQADITALGWYYIPVVMLSASLAIAVACLTNNIQRRYPVFWLTPEPLRPKPPPPEPEHSTLVRARSIRGSEEVHTMVPENRVIVTASELIVPDSLDLEEENKGVFEAIQKLLQEQNERENPTDNNV